MAGLTVALATFNEEENIGRCLDGIKNLASEIIIVDGSSTDKTVEIAGKYTAKIHITKNNANFHINKQKALSLAANDWILLLDADEVVSEDLAKEISLVIHMSERELSSYEEHLPNRKLFLRHQKLIEMRDGTIGEKSGDYTAFFIPRLNYFLGKYLRFGGLYPDGVIRLFKKGKAYLPAVDVHEQMVVTGKVGWLANPLYHFDSPTFARYLKRNNRYIDFLAIRLSQEKTGTDLPTKLNYLFVKPAAWFFMTQIRHKGILDGYRGMLFSFFSALRFPRAYLRYIKRKK
jgi:glycosyltransferase involved in cell wall biosynthesis